MRRYNKLRKGVKINLFLMAIAMYMGTSTHVVWALNNGFLSDNYNAPFFTQLFWDSLTFLDPIAAVLLFVRPKQGLYLTLLIIVADVVHNNLFYFDELYINAPEIGVWLKRYWMILGQLIFAAFVIVTFKRNLKEINLKGK